MPRSQSLSRGTLGIFYGPISYTSVTFVTEASYPLSSPVPGPSEKCFAGDRSGVGLAWNSMVWLSVCVNSSQKCSSSVGSLRRKSSTCLFRLFITFSAAVAVVPNRTLSRFVKVVLQPPRALSVERSEFEYSFDSAKSQM